MHQLIAFPGPNELSYCNIDGVTSTLDAHGLPKGPCLSYLYHQFNFLTEFLQFMTDKCHHLW